MTLEQAIRFKDVAAVHEALQGGADPDAPIGDTTPLALAAEAGSLEVAKALIDCGAHRDTALPDGRLPADLAEQRGFAELAELLRPVGA